MEKFKPTDFVKLIGQKLVMEFDHARLGGTPGLIGSAREHPARKQLEKLLPNLASIGTGILIDSFGGFSKQQDIVCYEHEHCPVYSVNDASDSTYYPVEGVIAVGEVKSSLDKNTLIDSLKKIKSAKILQRFSERTNDFGSTPAASYRLYGNSVSFAATREVEYDHNNKHLDQVYGFIICRNFVNSPNSILKNIIEFGQEEGFDCLPNMIVSLNEGFIQPSNHPSFKLQHSVVNANSIAFCPDTDLSFANLVWHLQIHAREGRTVPISAFHRYMERESNPNVVSILEIFPNT